MNGNRLLFIGIVGVLIVLVLAMISASNAVPNGMLAVAGLAEWLIGIGLVLLVIRVLRDRLRR